MLRQTKKYLTICQDLITAIQVIQPKLGIIVISSVSEGIIICTCVCAAVGISRGMITPSIIGVAYKLCSACIVNAYNITLQILFEIEGVENVFCIAACAILHSNRRARFIVQIRNKMIAPLFADNTATVEGVFMRNRVVIGLTCPYSFIIVSERIGIHTYTCISQSAAIFPSEVEAVIIAFGISDGIVGDTYAMSLLHRRNFGIGVPAGLSHNGAGQIFTI